MRPDQGATLRHLTPKGSLASIAPVSGSRVVAITGGKGGVGKSSIAVNLAVAYARRGSRTLALDGDMGMADLNLLLGVAPLRTMLDVIRGLPVESALVEAHGIHLLPALNGSHTLANLDAAAREHLFAAVDTLGDRFDTLVVDTPSGLGDDAMAFTGAAAEVVVVATPEPLSLADAYACLKVLATRHGLERACILPNRVHSPSEADEVVSRLSSLVARFLGMTLTPLPAIPFDPAVSIAASASTPFVIYSPDSPASRAISRVARRLDELAKFDSRRVRFWLRQTLGQQDEGAL